MSPWRIYYGDGSAFDGLTRQRWQAAPSESVQVVAIFEPTWPQPFAGAPTDRRLLTGEDVYDPFGWGAKRGSPIDRAAYDAIWGRARGDPRP